MSIVLRCQVLGSDPRDDQGKRDTWTYLLTLVCMGLASGQKTPHAICRGAHWHKEELLDLLQAAYRQLPWASRFYRILPRVDVEALEELIAAYGRASAPDLAQLWRGQWTIENRSHYVRDERMGEDRG